MGWSGVNARALTNDTTVLSAFRLCCLVTAFRSGQGGTHLWLVPKSPKVPTMASHAILSRTSVAASPACQQPLCVRFVRASV